MTVMDTCASCRFWIARKGTVTLPAPLLNGKGPVTIFGDGWCHRYPEEVHKGSAGGFCGEWLPKSSEVHVTLTEEVAETRSCATCRHCGSGVSPAPCLECSHFAMRSDPTDKWEPIAAVPAL